MTNNIDYGDVCIQASNIKKLLERTVNNDAYRDAAKLSETIEQLCLVILRQGLTDNTNILYFKYAKPLYNICKGLDRDARKLAYKLMETLTPDFILQKRINDNIQYQAYLNTYGR